MDLYSKYKITKEDIFIQRGVYNRAKITGIGRLRDRIYQVDENSIDPTPYTDQDEGWDPDRPKHTYVPLRGKGLLISNSKTKQQVK